MEMESENLNIEAIMAERRKALAESIQPISADELVALTDGFFTYPGHPWRETLRHFIAENPYETFDHATMEGGVHIFYCYNKNKGAWFLPHKGVGLLQVPGLKLMKEIVGGNS